MECLEINLPKEMEDVNTENYQTFLKESEEETNKWKDISMIERPPNYLHIWQNPNDFCAEIEKVILEFIQIFNEPPNGLQQFYKNKLKLEVSHVLTSKLTTELK